MIFSEGTDQKLGELFDVIITLVRVYATTLLKK